MQSCGICGVCIIIWLFYQHWLPTKRFYDKYFHGVGWEPRNAIFDEQWIIIIDDSAHFHHLLNLRITARQNATHSDVSSTAQPLLFLPRNILGPRCIPTRRLWETTMLISVINSILRPGQNKSHFTDDILDLTVAYRNCFFFIQISLTLLISAHGLDKLKVSHDSVKFALLRHAVAQCNYLQIDIHVLWASYLAYGQQSYKSCCGAFCSVRCMACNNNKLDVQVQVIHRQVRAHIARWYLCHSAKTLFASTFAHTFCKLWLVDM